MPACSEVDPEGFRHVARHLLLLGVGEGRRCGAGAAALVGRGSRRRAALGVGLTLLLRVV